MKNKLNCSNQIQLHKTRIPIMFIFDTIIAIFAIIFFIARGMVWWGVFFYTGVISGLFYFIFSRYSCIFRFCKNKLHVIYFAFWLKNKEVDLSEIKDFDFRKGFYDLLSDKPQLEYYNILCFDTITIYLRNGKKLEINLNTRIGDFRKIREVLNYYIKANYFRNKKN